MKLHIIISSAIILEEKDMVKAHLFEMERRGLLDIAEVYDCNDKSTTLSGGKAGGTKQSEINEIIRYADWFICLAPETHVGKKTTEEVEVAARALRTRAFAVSLFHPLKGMAVPTSYTTGRDKVMEVIERFNSILGIMDEQYWVDYVPDSNHQGLLDKLEEQFLKLQKDVKFPSQRLGSYSRKGLDVRPEDLFYDIHRSEPRYGYNVDFYIWRRSVDEDLLQKLRNAGHKFIFVKGCPSSGKSRAVIECLHGQLKDEQVVVMNRHNANDVCLSLLHETALDQEMRRREQESTFSKTHYYFVADQVRDVLQTVSEDTLKKFLKLVAELPNLTMLGTSTPQPLTNFLDDYKDIVLPLDNNGQIATIDIPLLSHDIESNTIMAMLRNQYEVDSGETIGDFIPALKGYKEHIALQIEEKSKHEDFSYLPVLMASLQLVITFRHTTPLFLAVMLLRNKASSDDDTTFSTACARCLNFLLEQNVIWVNDVKGGEVRKFDGRKDFTFSKFFHETYDHEEFESIVSVDLVFTVNELLWDHLQQTDVNRQGIKFFYDFFAVDGIKKAFIHFFDTFPTAASLRRMLPRIPKQRKWTDRKDHDERLAIIWDMTRKLVDKLDRNLQPQEEMKTLYFTLIGRAHTIEQVDDVLRLLRQDGFTIDADVIGEMYLFSRRLTPGTTEHRDFLACIEGYEKELAKKPATLNDIYRLSQHIGARGLNFSQAQELADHAFSQLKKSGNSGEVMKGLDVIAGECSDETSLIRQNVEFLLGVFAKLCSSIDDVRLLARQYQCLKLFPTVYSLHRMALHFDNESHIASVIDILMPTLADRQQNKSFYEQFVASVLRHLNSFRLSTWLCDKLAKETGAIETGPQLVSLCLQNCQKNEFQKAVEYVRSLPNANAIIYNNLIRLAPTVDDTYLVLNMMPKGYADDYTLSNCLSRVRDYANRHGAKRDNTQVSHNVFYNAFEFANHPRLRPFRTRPTCLNNLFTLTTNKEQDAYVCRLLQENEQYLLTMNMDICTTRIMKGRKSDGYRSFVETFEEIYTPAFHAMPKAGKLRPDLFNAMCSVWQISQDRHETKAMECKEKLLSDINALIDRKRIIQDAYFFLNYQVKMNGFKVFNNDGTQTTENFRNWLSGKTGNADFADEKVAERMILYFFNREKVPARITWNRLCTLYSCFREEFRDMTITPTTFSVMIKSFLKLKKEGLDTHADFEFIDRQLTTMHPKRDKGMNSAIKQLAEAGVVLTYDTLFPETANRHAHHNRNISKAETMADIVAILEEEIRDCGIVAPSTINSALYRARDLAKNKNGRTQQYDQIKEFILHYQLADRLTARSYSLLALLSTNKQDTKMWLDRFEKSAEISIISYGELGAERKIYDDLDIEVSRKYFRRWVNLLREIYDSNKKLARYMPEVSWATIGRHLRLELNSLELIRPNDVGRKTEVARTLAFIVTLYGMSTFVFNENNFTSKTSPNQLIECLEELVPLNLGSLTWKDVQASIEKKGWYKN